MDDLAVAMNNDLTAELLRLREKADMMARAVEQFIARQWPKHSSPDCEIYKTAKEDWRADGCAFKCPLCLLNRSLSVYRGRA